MGQTRIDLSYLDRLYKGDRSRMAQWINIYLEEAPAQFKQLSKSAVMGDVEGLIVAAHDLRPQAHYVGASRMVELLIAIEQRARSEGTLACTGLLNDVLSLGRIVDAELRAWVLE